MEKVKIVDKKKADTGKSNGAFAGVRVPQSAVVGALAVLGSVAMGAVAVL